MRGEIGQTLAFLAQFLFELAACGADLQPLFGDGEAHVEQGRAVRFDEVIIRPGFEDLPQVGRFLARRAHEDIGAVAVGLGAQPTAKIEPAHAGQE